MQIEGRETMDTSKQTLPLPSSDTLKSLSGDIRLLINSECLASGHSCGHSVDGILDIVVIKNFHKNSNTWRSLDIVDIVNTNSYAREENIHTHETGNKEQIKISRARLNRNNYVHYVQKRKNINKLITYKNSTMSKTRSTTMSTPCPTKINRKEIAKMSRIWWVSRLLKRWFRWRNSPRTRIACTLSLENDVVDSSRRQNDLVNARGVDFQMFRLEKAIFQLDAPLRDAVLCVYGQEEWIGYHAAARILGIHCRTLHRYLCDADRQIEEKLESQNESHERDK